MPIPSPRSPHLRALYELPTRPADSEIGAAAELLVAYVLAEKKRFPSMAISAILRAHRTAAKLPAKVVAALMEQSGRLLPERVAPEVELQRQHLPTRAAAKLLGEAEDALHTRMALVAQRRLYGWPYWDGRHFRFPLLALRAETRPAYLAALPEREPAPIADTLPLWCSRQDAGPDTAD
jgi:hypothetical protein